MGRYTVSWRCVAKLDFDRHRASPDGDYARDQLHNLTLVNLALEIYPLRRCHDDRFPTATRRRDKGGFAHGGERIASIEAALVAGLFRKHHLDHAKITVRLRHEPGDEQRQHAAAPFQAIADRDHVENTSPTSTPLG